MCPNRLDNHAQSPLAGRARAVTFTAGAALACLLAASAGGAHALLVASTPAEGETLIAPARLVLRFNSRIEKALSSVTLVGPKNTRILLPRATPDSGPDTLVYPLPPLKPGAYQARWKVLSADGHVTEGPVTFSVVAPPSER